MAPAVWKSCSERSKLALLPWPVAFAVQRFMDFVTRAGGLAGTVRCPDDALRLLSSSDFPSPQLETST